MMGFLPSPEGTIVVLSSAAAEAPADPEDGDEEERRDTGGYHCIKHVHFSGHCFWLIMSRRAFMFAGASQSADPITLYRTMPLLSRIYVSGNLNVP